MDWADLLSAEVRRLELEAKDWQLVGVVVLCLSAMSPARLIPPEFFELFGA
jgi:hypothetical protein